MSTLGIITLCVALGCVVALIYAFSIAASRHPLEEVSAGTWRPIDPSRPKAQTEWSDQHWIRTGLVLSHRSPDQWRGVVQRLDDIEAELAGRPAPAHELQLPDHLPQKYEAAWLAERIRQIEQQAGLVTEVGFHPPSS